MRLSDPMGIRPVHYYPTQGKPPYVMVSKSPFGWFLFLRHRQLEDVTPSYGVDWDGWVGYHYPREEVSSGELLQRGRVESVKPAGG